MNVLVLVGGPSAEHEVSLVSGANIVRALRASKNKNYNVLPVGITKDGRWQYLANFPDDIINQHSS